MAAQILLISRMSFEILIYMYIVVDKANSMESVQTTSSCKG